MMVNGKKISLCLPTRNEGSHIAEFISQVPEYIDEIILVSNRSTDDTVKVAKAIKDKRLKVFEDNRTLKGIGYGFAHITAFSKATGDIIVASDSDATYPIEDVNKIVKYLHKNKLDFISCNRYPLKDNTKIPLKLRLGVSILNLEIRLLYRIAIKDALSGMWVFRKEIIDDLNLTMGDWNLSPQIKINAARHKKINFAEHSIAQHQRKGETHQKYFRTGFAHAAWILKNRFFKNRYNLDNSVLLEDE
jgi:glycosyltransferase involved in cell wall biosynthesis